MEPQEYKPGWKVLEDTPEDPSPLSLEEQKPAAVDSLSIGHEAKQPSAIDALSTYLEGSLGREKAAFVEDLMNGQYESLAYESDMVTEDMRKDRARRKAEEILSSQEGGEERLAALGDVTESLFFWQHLAPEVGPILEGMPEMKEIDRRRLDSVFAAQRIVQDRLADQPWYKDLGDFADLALSSGPQNILDLLPEDQTFEGAGALRDLAREASDLMLRGLSPEEFDREFNAILDRVEEAGFFTDENIWYVAGFLDLVAEGGEGFWSRTESVFQAMDVALLPLTVLPFVPSASFLYKGAHALKAMSTLKSFKTAVSTTVDVVERGSQTLATEAGSVAMINPGVIGDKMLTSPDLVVRRQLEANNAALKFVKDSAWGELLDEEQLQKATAEWTATIKEKNEDWLNRTQEVNYFIENDHLGNPVGGVLLGKVGGGEGFKVQRFAEEFAESIGGSVVESMVSGERRFFVRKEWNLPTEGFVDPTDVKEVATGFFSTILSSTFKEPPMIDALAKRGEAQISRNLRTLGRDYLRLRNKAGNRNVGLVNGIMEELRDDPNFFRNTPYDVEEFGKRFYDKYGEMPNQDTINYYSKMVELNDTDYYIQADIILKESVNNGEEMVKVEGNYYLGKKVDDIPEDATVFDPKGGQLRLRRPEDDVYEIKHFEYSPEGVGPVRYVAGEGIVTRRIYHSDVLPYNAGGHRTPAGISEHFLKQDKDITLATGEKVQGSPSTFLAARTEAEANLAVRQINTIIDTINESDSLAEVNAVIRANRDWNLNIEDYDDFRNYMARYNLDETKRVVRVEDKGLTPAQKAVLKSGKTTFYHSGAASARGRKDIPLTRFGGEELQALDPSKAIERGFAKTIARKGNQIYDYRAINSWVNFVKKNPESITNYPEIATLPAKEFFKRAEPVKLTKAGRALAAQQRQINFRLSNTTSRIAQENRLFRRISEFVYNKGMKKLSKALDWASTKDPIGFTRAVAFHSKLGMWNPDQLYVQGNQLMNILGVGVGSVGPVKTMQALLSVAPMRIALVDNIPDAALTRIAGIQKAFTGISEEDFILLRNWIKSTGRDVIDKTVVEENNTVSFLGKSRALQTSQFFFTEGELSGRLGAAALNLIERRIKYGQENIFSDRVTNAMIQRQDVLTASMTSASAAPWQRSALALPLQFVTYHIRMVEQILTNGILTPKERASLAFTHVLAYGAAAVPATGWFVDRLAHEGKIDPNDKMYDLARYGALDAFLSILTGEETALTPRLAVGDGLFDLLRATGEESLLETAMGPGGQIGWEFIVAFNSMQKNIFAGKFNHLTHDWNRFARNVSSYDKGYKYWMAHRYGQMVSRKSGSLMRDDLTGMEGVLTALGIGLKEEREAWMAVDMMKLDKQGFNQTVKEVTRLGGIVSRMVQDKDYDGAARMIEDIGAHLELLNTAEREKLLGIMKNNMSMHESVVEDLIENYKLKNAERLMELTND